MTKRDLITEKAKELLSLKPEGLHFSQLIAALAKAFPGEPTGTLTAYTWNLHTRFSDEIFKPGRGLFRATKYQSNEEVQADLAAKKESAVTMTDFDETIKDIRSRFPHLKFDDVFVLWFLVAHLIDDEEQAAKYLVGGAGDKGIDAIWIDESAKAVFVVQGKFRESLGEKSEQRNDVLGLLDVARQLCHTDDERFKGYLAKMGSFVAARLPDARKRILDHSFRILLYFVTLNKPSTSV